MGTAFMSCCKTDGEEAPLPATAHWRELIHSLHVHTCHFFFHIYRNTDAALPANAASHDPVECAGHRHRAQPDSKPGIGLQTSLSCCRTQWSSCKGARGQHREPKAEGHMLFQKCLAHLQRKEIVNSVAKVLQTPQHTILTANRF